MPRTAWAAVLILAVASLGGCNKLLAKKPGEKAPEEKAKETQVVIPIEAGYPERADISACFGTNSRVQAENRVEVIAEGVGECLSVLVEEGDHVEKDQILAELDKEEPLAMLRQLEIQVAQTKTSYDIAERSLAEGLGAKVERDNAKFAHDQAVANLDAQRLKVKNLTIRAPIAGVITRKNIQKGQMVSSAVPVFSLVDPNSHYVEINPPEKELPKLQIGQLAKVTVDALPGEEFDAYVRRVNPAVDPLTGTIKVVLDFDEATRIRLRESAFARVRLIMETHQQALVVPKDVLVEENGRKYVFVVEEEQPQAEEEAAELPETTGNEAAAPSVTETEASDKAGENAGEPETESPDAPPEDADAESTNTEDSKPEEPMLVAQRVEVETGFEDSSRVEIVSGIGDDSLIVTLGQHTLKPGSYVRVASAEVLLNEKKDMSVEEALAEAEAKKAKADQDSAESRRHTRH